MENSKFFIPVDLDNPKQVNAAAAFFNALNGTNTETAPTPKKRMVKAKVETVIAKTEVVVETEKTDPAVATEKVDKTEGVTIEAVRKLVSEKAKEHKTAIKAELTRLDAPNVTKLKEEHYASFVEFLKTL